MSDGADQPEMTSNGTVLLLDSDLFFVVKVTETLARAGYAVRKARTIDAFVAALGETSELDQPGAERPAAALVNLAARGVDALAAIARAREAGVPVVAYGPHVDVAAQAAARQAGATSVIANAKLDG
ncbi:MAG TPA: hypothetical protein VIG30_01225, partial [Ktedonobacterales bacterium]